MHTITVSRVDRLECRDVCAIIDRLTHEESEWQQELRRAVDSGKPSVTPVALWHESGSLLGWCCSHKWQGMQTIETFVDESERGNGIATALAACLAAAGVLDRARPVAVFSDDVERMANRMGFAEVLRYEWNGSAWAWMP
jgi:hypothetical protein